MSAYSMEQTVFDGRMKINQLFEFVKNSAEKMDSYSMEEAIFQRVMSIGRTAMKSYFAVKGTGDVGNVLVLEDGTVLNKEKRVLSRNYFSVLVNLVFPALATVPMDLTD